MRLFNWVFTGSFACLFSLCFNSAAIAEVYSGPAQSALGRTGRAGLSSSENAFVNPAAIILVKKYEFNLYYRDGYIDAGQHRNGWVVGAVDNSEGVWMPGSLHYGQTRDTGLSENPANGEIWHGAIAYMVSNRLSLGVSGYRLHHKVKDDRSYEQWNYSLGSLVLITNDLAVAYVVDNLAKPGSRVPQGLRQDLEHGIGVFYRAVDVMTLRFDITRHEKFNPDHKMAYMVGVESATSEWFSFRMGYRRDELADQHIWSTGFGFNGPRLKMDYALEKNQERTDGILHSVDLRVPF